MATRDNPQITAFDERLRAAGKVKKVALTACMRKLLTMLNALRKHRTPWQPQEVQNEKIYKAPLTTKTVATLLRRCGFRARLRRSVRGAADQAAHLMRCKSSAVHGPLRTASLAGAWAGNDPREVRMEQPRLPYGRVRSGRSDRGGAPLRACTCVQDVQPRHRCRTAVAGRGVRRAAPVRTRGRPRSWRTPRVAALDEPPGAGATHAGHEGQNTVGHVLLPAGADSHRPRPAVRGSHRDRGRVADWRLGP